MGLFASLFGKESAASKVIPFSITKDELFAILSVIQDGVIVLDENKNIVLANKAALDIIGMPISPVIDSQVAQTRGGGGQLENILGKPFNQIVKLFDNSIDITESVWSNLSKDSVKFVSNGKETDVRLQVQQLAGQSGQGGWVILVHDIGLENRLAGMQMSFVSMAAHELRTPITSISGYLTTLIDAYNNTFNEDQKNLLSHIETNTQRLKMLVDNLLNVSRIERGAITVSIEDVDLVAIVKQAVGDLSERATGKGIQLRFIPPQNQLPFVRADKVRITEVISNLISNAISYTDANGRIEVQFSQKGQEIITHVSDTGHGIPKEALPHLFGKFYRVNQGLVQNARGLGLGLYISKAIIEMHQGKIWVESEVGKGSTFSFSLPVSPLI